MINAINFYRIARKAYIWKIPLIPKIIKLLIFLIYNSVIPYEANIGRGTKLGYGGIGVVIHKKVFIGKDCNVSQNVTIGGKEGEKILPKIGDNVDICAGAKIIGNVNIGNNVVIGVNSVVLKDIPDNAVVAGIPAKILKFKS